MVNRIIEKYFTILIIGLVSIVEVIVTGGESAAIGLLIPYGIYKIVMHMVKNS